MPEAATSDAVSLAADRPLLTARVSAGSVGLLVLLLIAVPCFVTLPWSTQHERYRGAAGDEAHAREAPSGDDWMGTDALGRSLAWRCLLGGAVSLGIGASAALIAVAIGVAWGAIAGYAGGRVDAVMMRIVDVLYGLPYVLLVVLFALAVDGVVGPSLLIAGDLNTPWIVRWPANLIAKIHRHYPHAINLATLAAAIGGVSWLTMSRVIRGQVLSLRSQPFVEAARACGVGPLRILRVHLLPNLVGPIVVYATLTVPQAILQESFLSFLGIGVRDPMPSWGNLAAAGVAQMPSLALGGGLFAWWMLLWPCLLLALTLLSLNFLGDALRARFDPRSLHRR